MSLSSAQKKQGAHPEGELVTREALIRALRAYRALRKLGQSELAALGLVQDMLQTVSGSGAEDDRRGMALRKVLSEALNCLKPEAREPNTGDERWYGFIILQEQYIQRRPVDFARQQLDPKGRGVSLRTYHRYRVSALDRLVDELRTRELERAQRLAQAAASPSEAPTPPPSEFIGRHTELATLHSWLAHPATRVIGLLGLGGVGKTALAKQLAAGSASRFEQVVWLSLHNGPPLAELLTESLQSLLGADLEPEYLEPTQLLSHFLQVIRHRPCLVVWDNFETLLEPGQPGGRYRAGYEEYGSALTVIAQASGPSRLVLTSREMPPGWSDLAARSGAILMLQLEGLDLPAGHALLANTSLHGDETAWARFVQAYSGNPLVLKITADVVAELFGGDLAHYLKAGVPLLADAQAVLQQQFERLDPRAQDLLLWLAVEREPVTPAQLGSRFVPGLEDRALYEVLYDLRRRSLIERADGAFTLQQVVLEFLAERLIADMARELSEGRVSRLQTHSLLTVDARDYVLQSQRRQLLQPLAERLQRLTGSPELATACGLTLLETTRHDPKRQPGYLAGNLVNLLQALGHDLRGLNLDGRCLWQAHFAAAPLINVNLAGADLAHTAFMDVFDGLASTTWSPDGKLFLAGTNTGDIRIWRAADGKPLRTLAGHSDWVRSLAVSRDGRLLASASSDHTARVWDLRTGECLHILTAHARRVRRVALSPDGRRLVTAGDDGDIRVWDTVTGDCLLVLRGHTDRVYALAFAPDGQTLVSGSWDHTLRVWAVADWGCRVVVTGHSGWVRSVAISSDGARAVTAAQDNTLRIWDTRDWRCLHTLTGHTAPAHEVVFNYDGKRIASGGEDATIRIWDAGNGVCLAILTGHHGFVESVAFAPHRNTLTSAGIDQSLRLWDADQARCLKVFTGHSNRLWTLDISPDDRWIAAGSNDQRVRIWDLSSGTLLRTWRAHSGWVENVGFDRSGRWLATASDDTTLKIWECGTWRPRFTFTGHTRWCGALAFHPAYPLFVSGGEDQTIRVWSLETGECLRVLEGSYDVTRTLNFSPDGRWLLSAGDLGTVFVWDTATWEIAQQLDGHRDVLWCLAFDLTGQRLATAGEDRTIVIWDTSRWQPLRRMDGHTNRVFTLAFHPNQPVLASCSTDRTLRLWDVEAGVCRSVRQSAGPLRQLVFDSSGQRLITSDDSDTLKVWETETGRWLSDLRAERLYDGLDITGAVGLSPAQWASLLSLGAVDRLDGG